MKFLAKFKAKMKNKMLSHVGEWGLASVLDVQSLIFFTKENWIWAVTRHHANNILTRNFPFCSCRQTVKPSFDDAIALFVG